MELLHLKRRFYEALCVLHASGVSSTQKYEAQLTLHEAALRAMKRSLFRLHVFCPSGQKNGISNGSFSEVHLTLKSYCFSAFLPEVWLSVAHHDLICDIRISGKKWGKSALHGEKTGKIFNTNQPILKPGPARQAPIYCGSSDVVAERFFAAYYLPLIPTDLKTLKYSIFSLFFNSNGENMGNKSTQKTVDL